MVEETGNTFRIARLLIRRLTGVSTDSDEQELSAWKAGNPDNEALSERWLDRAYAREQYERCAGIETERYKNQLSQYIRGSRRRRDLRMVASVAAGVALILGAFFFLRPAGGESGSIAVPLISGNLPILQLEEKMVIPVDSGLFLQQPGVVIAMESGKTLSFKREQGSEKPELGYNSFYVPKGAEYDIVLEDGTHVWLNADSKITFPNHFPGDCREVELSGEAFFSVTKDTARPFRVKTGEQVVEVLGTTFNINAYPEEKRVYTTLVEGSVVVSAPGHSTRLVPGRQSIFGNDTLLVRKVNPEAIAGWRSGLFVLDGYTLEEVISALSRWYNFEVIYQNEQVKQITLSGSIPRYESFQKILEYLEWTKTATFKVKNNTVIVME